jgi:hydrogenase maturation protease
MRALVLGLGNELLSDDAVGVLAARTLEGPLAGRADVVASALHGLALLDVFSGYDAAIVVDAVATGTRPVGTVAEIDPASLRPVAGASPHFAGLPEMLELAERLGMRFPSRLRLLTVEVRDLYTVGGRMSPEVSAALPVICESVMRALDEIERSQAGG